MRGQSRLRPHSLTMFSIGPLQIDLPKMHFCDVLELELTLLWLLGGELDGDIPFITRVADRLLCKRILSSSSTSWILAGCGAVFMLGDFAEGFGPVAVACPGISQFSRGKSGNLCSEGSCPTLVRVRLFPGLSLGSARLSAASDCAAGITPARKQLHYLSKNPIHKSSVTSSPDSA